MSVIRTIYLVLAATVLGGCSLLDFSPYEERPYYQELSSRGGGIHGRSAVPGVSESQEAFSLPALVVEDNAEVRREILEYSKGNGRCIRAALDAREEFYPTLKQIFEDQGIPIDLINLALIESGFRTNARSPAGAVGMWQFTRATARNYGLRVDSKVDQRTDVIRSTYAAARHLRDLYRQHGDWAFVLAAYNAGSGAVGQARRRFGEDDFWAISRHGGLSSQTRRFVPKFMAASILVQTMERYGSDNLRDNAFALLSANGSESSLG